ncbi:hypothetical protein ACFL4E_03590 [Candidatus Omnitrophota bacterium]
MKKLLIVLLITCVASGAFATPPMKSPMIMPEIVNLSEYTLKEEIELDLDKDGKKEKVRLYYRPTDDAFALFLLVVRKDKSNYSANTPILAPKNLCSLEEIVLSPERKPLIGVTFPVGAHSEWLGIYSFTGKSIKELNNLFSDGPSIAVKDLDNDGTNDIEITNRDYDNNPVKDSLIITYRFGGGRFREASTYRTNPGKYMTPDEKEEYYGK